MSQVDPQQFYKDLDGSSLLPPLMFFYGEEPYLIDQAVERIKLKALSDIEKDFNFDLFYASDCEVSQVVEAVESFPIMARQRLVILKESQAFSESEWNRLSVLFDSPVKSTALVMTASLVDKRKKIFKKLIDSTYSVEFKKPFENQIPRWIHYIAQTLDLQISDSGADLLHRLVGNHLLEIESELKKLGENVQSNQIIEASDVEKIVSRSKEESVFDFIESIGERDRILALNQLNYLLQQGQNQIGIISLTARHIRILLKTKKGLEMGLHGSKLAHYVQVPSFFINKYTSQAQQWSDKRLKKILILLSRTDLNLKSSPISSQIWLEDMVFSIFQT